MYVENEENLSECIQQLTREIWLVIRLVLAQEARQDDVKGAVEKANYLRLYIDSYKTRQNTLLPESTIWLAGEMVDAVVDLID